MVRVWDAPRAERGGLCSEIVTAEISGVGYGVWGVGCRVRESQFRAADVSFNFQVSGFVRGVTGFGFWESDLGYWEPEYWVSMVEIKV